MYLASSPLSLTLTLVYQGQAHIYFEDASGFSCLKLSPCLLLVHAGISCCKLVCMPSVFLLLLPLVTNGEASAELGPHSMCRAVKFL